MDGHCNKWPSCPRVFKTDQARVVVQGYAINEAEVPAFARPPTGERQVEMPWETFLMFARQAVDRPAPFDFESARAEIRRSAFRLETLQQYLVPEEAEEFDTFRRTGRLPEVTVGDDPWLRHLKHSTEAGIRWYRVRLVRRPHTPYTRYELASYEMTARVGQETRIVDLDQHPELATMREDFWLMDGDDDHAFVILMRYDPEGHFLGAWRADDPDVLARCRRERDVALAASMPLDEYVALAAR